jgi:hypothetical protein
MDEAHREAVTLQQLTWPVRDARARDESNATIYAQAEQDLAQAPAPVAHAMCSFVRRQANCEKPIRAIFFCASKRPAKARMPVSQDLTGPVGRGTVKCATAA